MHVETKIGHFLRYKIFRLAFIRQLNINELEVKLLKELAKKTRNRKITLITHLTIHIEV